MASAENIQKMNNSQLQSMSDVELEGLLKDLNEEKLSVLAQVARVRAQLNVKLRNQQIQDRFGSAVADLVTKMSPDEVARMLKSKTQELKSKEQVLQPKDAIAVGSNVKPANASN